MRIVFIGCVEFSRILLEKLLEQKDTDVIGIVTKNASPENADFCSLSDVAKPHNIPVYLYHQNNQALAEWITAQQADVAYCFGWSHLLPQAVLTSTRLGVVGYHPAALPQNRGRHPIIWALTLGLKETASTFFFMDSGTDSGDLLDQQVVSIDSNDNARSLYDKLIATACNQLTSFTPALADNSYPRIPQNHSQANTWRKRSKADGEIDWRMSARSIHNLVRALSSPYPGAHYRYQGKEIKIWETTVIENIADNIEPGKVLDSDEQQLIIKCGEGAVALTNHEFTDRPKQGSYL